MIALVRAAKQRSSQQEQQYQQQYQQPQEQQYQQQYQQPQEQQQPKRSILGQAFNLTSSVAGKAHSLASSAASSTSQYVKGKVGNTAFGRVLDEMASRVGINKIGPLYFNFETGKMEATYIAPQGYQTKVFASETVGGIKKQYQDWIAKPDAEKRSKTAKSFGVGGRKGRKTRRNRK